MSVLEWGWRKKDYTPMVANANLIALYSKEFAV